jgi:hypothetical protein
LRHLEWPGEDTAVGGENEDGVAAAIEGELRLMNPAVRTSRELAGALLDPEFTEVGRSGRRWHRADMLAELPEMQSGETEASRYRPSDITGVLLAPGLVHLTYETTFTGRRAHRSSLWRRTGTGPWRMYYHQATPVPDGASG